MIRQAQAADVQAILTIYNDAILHTTSVYKYAEETLAERQLWLQEKKDKKLPVFVFEEEGVVIGFATYGPFRVYPAYQYTIENSIYVHPDHSGKGIASKLMTRLIEQAKQDNYKTVIACIDADNEASIKLHQKFGFTYSGTLSNVGYKFDKWLHLALYQLDLGESSK